MSPIRMGNARPPMISYEEVAERTNALRTALDRGNGQLSPEFIDRAKAAVSRSSERTQIAGDHTVVALAGATGSGKSSLFNAIVGAEVATIGARRPTTSRPAAAVWGEPADELLDWLRVKTRHHVDESVDESADELGAESVADSITGSVGSLDGLVLLDLPDFDSREATHRAEAERILDLVDVFVWVTDPQKYADARMHDEFVTLMAHHDAVTIGVLNQVDRLPTSQVGRCLTDFSDLLKRDGLSSASVIATSVTTGRGLPELRQRLANAVAGHAASRVRIANDVASIGAAGQRTEVAATEPAAASLPRKELDAALAKAAGVPIVLDAVARDYRREAFAHTGWLFARWTRGFAADPLRRLRLDRTGGRPAIEVDITGEEVRAVTGRSSIPAPTAATRALTDAAGRAFADAASTDLPTPWAHAIEDRIVHRKGDLSDALDRAILATSLRSRRPIWWLVVNVLQWALGFVAIAGLIWMLILWGMSILQMPKPETPAWGILPLPLIMLLGASLLGLGLGGLSRWWAKIGAQHRRSVIAKRLDRSMARVGDDHVIAPTEDILSRHRQTREALVRAQG